MSIESLLMSIRKQSVTTTTSAPVASSNQPSNPFANSVFNNSSGNNGPKASFNNNQPIQAYAFFQGGSNSNFGSTIPQNNNSIFNGVGSSASQSQPQVTRPPSSPAAQSGSIADLMNLLKSLIAELQTQKGTEEPKAEEKKEKKEEGGGFFGFIKKAVSAVVPMATSLLGGAATGGMGNIATGLLGKLFGGK